MSTILKALKQSEARRPRDGGLPDSLPAAVEARRARSAWLLALVAAVLSAGAAAWWFLDRGEAPGRPESAQRRVAEVQLPERGTAAPAGQEDDAGTAGADASAADGTTAPGNADDDAGAGATAGAGDGSGAANEEPPAPEGAGPEQRVADTAAPPGDPEGEPTATADETATGAAQRLDPYAMLPRLAHLSDQRRSSLPGLKLNAHVYASQTEQRFVLIDLSRYGEGDTIAPGVTVAAIFPGGVVIEDGQGRFVVPRP